MKFTTKSAFTLALVLSANSYGAVENSFTLRGGLAVSDVEILDENLSGVSLEGSYGFAPNVEAGIGITSLSSSASGVEVSVTTLSAFVKGSLDVSPKISVFGQLALTHNEVKAEAFGFTATEDEPGYDLGLGAQIAFSEKWSAQLINKWRYLDGDSSSGEVRETSALLGYTF